jgi:hypothetical protein
MKGEGVGRTSMHDDGIHPHPALRTGLSLPGRGVSLLLRREQTAAFCPLARPTRTPPAGNVGATRWVARRGRGGRAPGMRSHDDGIDPHPALRAGLSLAGRGVSLLLRWKQPAAFCPLTRPTRTLPAGNVGATRWVAPRGRGGRAPGMTRAIVHDRTRAMHRIAHPCRACSRVRWAREHRKHLAAPVVGAVREPPPQCHAPRTRGSSQVLFPRSRNASEFAGSICCSRRKTACAFAVSPAANKNLA